MSDDYLLKLTIGMKIIMSSSEEFSNTSSEEYLSDDSECLDFEEVETEERVIQELLLENSIADKETDSELQAYMEERASC